MIVLDALARQPASAVALIEGDRQTSYGELRDAVQRTAQGLRALGVVPGDRVAIIGTNDTAMVVHVLAVMAAGAAAAPTWGDNPVEVQSTRLTALGATAILASPRCEEAALVAAEHNGLDVGHVGAGAFASVDGLAVIDAAPAAPPDIDPDSPALALFTSGIGGGPRIALLSHAATDAAAARLDAAELGHGPARTSLVSLPVSHVLGLNSVALAQLRAGGTLVLQRRWDPEEAVALIARHRVTTVVAVPPMWLSLCQVDSARDAFASVSTARSGATELFASVTNEVHEVLGVELSQSYGLTETAGTICIEPNARSRPGSVGRALPGVALRLTDHGHDVASGDQGEVWVRTPSLFSGYLDDPIASHRVLADGECATGDLGILDDDDSLYLLGRAKDVINVSGFNVYPGEVEAAIESMDTVREAVVVGEPAGPRGDRVVAYVVAASPAGVEAGAVQDHCRHHLSRYKVPEEVHVVDRVPVTAMGKRNRSGGR